MYTNIKMICDYNDYNCTYIEFSKSQAFPTALYFRLSTSVRAARALSTAFNMHICVHLFLPFYWLQFSPSRSGSSLKQCPCLILLYVPAYNTLLATQQLLYAASSKEYGSVFSQRYRFNHLILS